MQLRLRGVTPEVPVINKRLAANKIFIILAG